MTRLLFVLLAALASVMPAATVNSQTPQFWIQIADYVTVRSAMSRARVLSEELPDLHAFRVPDGSYVIALGPYEMTEALDRNATLIADGAISPGSFVTLGTNFVRQFWPAGNEAAPLPNPEIEPEFGVIVQEALETEPTPSDSFETVDPQTPTATQLSRDERRQIQAALKWYGDYNAVVDGIFGPATSEAISAYQSRNGLEPTGTLTDVERVVLTAAYEFDLVLAGLERLNDDYAGLSLEYPARLVKFQRYSPPFAVYEPATPDGVRLLLISMEGGERSAKSLYDVLQTMEIIPPEGPRHFDGSEFTIVGRGPEFRAHAFARQDAGRIKGFVAAWPDEMQDFMARVVGTMRASLRETSERTLDRLPSASGPAANFDRGAGMDRQAPAVASSGFFVDRQGTVVTSRRRIQECDRIVAGAGYPMTLLADDPNIGVAALAPEVELAPIGRARLSALEPSAGTAIAVVGHSLVGTPDAPTVEFGSVRSTAELNVSEFRRLIGVDALPPTDGGPVLDLSGSVVGMLIPDDTIGGTLPDGTALTASSAAILDFLSENGIAYASAAGGRDLEPAELRSQAADITVRIECFNDEPAEAQAAG